MSSNARRLELASRFTRTAVSCASLFTVGVFRSSGREQIGRLARLFGHTSLPAPELPMIRLEDVADDRSAVVLRDARHATGNVDLLELLVLARLVRARRPRRLLEIGTFDGRSTLNLAVNAPDDAVVYTLDLPDGGEETAKHRLDDAELRYVRKPRSGARVHDSDVAHKVVQLYGDSATFDFTQLAAPGIDFVFVDGSHAYDYARSDSLTALSLLRNGHGTIVWHDYNGWRGVSDALHELRRDDERFESLRWVEGTSLAMLEL
ncbi:MAG: class I SAM-dependent methyltransferase [Gemmatimonadaceae bacterium]